jgi:outer membrane immunogenic protein
MKRRFTLSAAVGLGLCLAQNALAANLPMPALAPAPPPPPSWSGFYLGANASFPWTDPINFTASDPNNAFLGLNSFGVVTTNGSDFGWALGPVVGYNLQLGSNWLIGVEGDIDWGTLSINTNQSSFIGNTNVAATGHIDVNSLASVRGRAGWIWNFAKSSGTFNLPGDYLFYGTGGVGWAKTQTSWDLSCPNTVDCATGAAVALNQTRTGDVWGGGMEFMPEVAKGKILWGVEYLHYHFKSNSATGTTVNLGTIPYTASALNINDVRVRVLYKWD